MFLDTNSFLHKTFPHKMFPDYTWHKMFPTTKRFRPQNVSPHNVSRHKTFHAIKHYISQYVDHKMFHKQISWNKHFLPKKMFPATKLFRTKCFLLKMFPHSMFLDTKHFLHKMSPLQIFYQKSFWKIVKNVHFFSLTLFNWYLKEDKWNGCLTRVKIIFIL